MLNAYCRVMQTISDFENIYEYPPNVIWLGSNVVHDLRRVSKYTTLHKLVTINARGEMTIEGIPVKTIYTQPDMIAVGIIIVEED